MVHHPPPSPEPFVFPLPCCQPECVFLTLIANIDFLKDFSWRSILTFSDVLKLSSRTAMNKFAITRLKKKYDETK